MSIEYEDIKYIISANLPWKSLTNKSILVTGITGMIPGYITKTLLYLNKLYPELNLKIYGLARNSNKATKIYHNHTINLLLFDVTTPLDKLYQFDYIIHGASLASPSKFKETPIETILPNVIGTYNLLQHTKNFLFISSPDVYGVTPSDISITEDSYGYVNPVNPRSCYGTSKMVGESLCIAFKNQCDINVKIVRPFHTYGPGLNLNDGRIFSDFVSNILNKEPILIKGSGNERRTFCYLSDAVLGIFYVLFHGINGEAYNIGNDKCEIKISELAKLLSSIYGLSIKYTDPSPTYLKSTNNRGHPDTTKTKSLGWECKVNIEEGFKRTIQSRKE